MNGYFNAMFIALAPPSVVIGWLMIFSKWVAMP